MSQVHWWQEISAAFRWGKLQSAESESDHPVFHQSTPYLPQAFEERGKAESLAWNPLCPVLRGSIKLLTSVTYAMLMLACAAAEKEPRATATGAGTVGTHSQPLGPAGVDGRWESRLWVPPQGSQAQCVVSTPRRNTTVRATQVRQHAALCGRCSPRAGRPVEPLLLQQGATGRLPSVPWW